MFFLITINSNNEKISTPSNYYHEVYSHPIEDDHFLMEAFTSDEIKVKLDKGWKFFESDTRLVWYKGYSTEIELSDLVGTDSIESYKGNYLCLVYEKNKKKLSVCRDTLPGFNIFYTEKLITNLYPTKHQVDYNELISISFKNKIVIEKQNPPQIFTSNIKKNISIKEAGFLLKDILKREIKNFFNYNSFEEVEVQFSGGLDTAVIIALMRDASYDFNIVDVRKERSINWKKKENRLASHLAHYNWGFRQNNIYPEDRNVAVLSGFWGDEFLMRNPLYVHWVLNYYDIDFLKEVSRRPKAYMSRFILSDYVEKINKNDKKFDSEESLYKTLSNWCLRNYQINHLNNTIMFTPYKNLEILNLSFRMSNKAILSQAIDGCLQKEVIRLCDSNILDKIDKSKNDR